MVACESGTQQGMGGGDDDLAGACDPAVSTAQIPINEVKRDLVFCEK